MITNILVIQELACNLKKAMLKYNSRRRNFMKLTIKGLNDKNWKEKGYMLPQFSIDKVKENTKKNPKWVHFGAGNIFRGFQAARMQDLIEQGVEDTGIIVGEGFDLEIIDKIYKPHDNLSLVVTLKSDGTIEKRVVASVVESYKCCPDNSEDYGKLKEIFRNPAFQMASFTITEKGYAMTPKYVIDDIERGPLECRTIIPMVTSLAYERFIAGAHPFSFVSMDNCSHNGEKLRNAVLQVATQWKEKLLVPKDFVDYISDEKRVSFPLSMIDKITPRPDADVKKMLEKDGFEDAEVIITSKRTYIAPYVNAEQSEYLVIEDRFPNGRPALEKAGIYFTDKDTVNKVERMKVCTCLNPLHTAMSVAGCLLGFKKISEEMKDSDIVNMIKTLGYKEGLPVVTDPKILNPKDFIDDVVENRLVNPFMPDTPQRIATDTSQKIAIRFGETVKSYLNDKNLNVKDLKVIPFVYALWIRYLMAIDDNGNEFTLSPDPMLEELQPIVSQLKLGNTDNLKEIVKPILENEKIFGYNLYTSQLFDATFENLKKMLSGTGKVRETLHGLFV